MCSTSIITNPVTQDPAIPYDLCSELPICPNGCGPLAFTPARASDCGRLHCQACEWHILLWPDEECDLVNAFAGLDVDLPLDLFLVNLVQKQVDQLDKVWSEADERANELRDRWQGLSSITVYTWHEWKAADAYEDQVGARHKIMVEALAKLRGVTPQAILGIPAGAHYGL